MALSPSTLSSLAVGILCMILVHLGCARRVRYPPGPYFAAIRMAVAREEAQELLAKWSNSYGMPGAIFPVSDADIIFPVGP